MKKDKTSIIIFIILVIIAVVAYFVLGGFSSNYGKLKTLIVNTTSGKKVQTEYSSIKGYNFFIKVPTEFKEMSLEEKAVKYPIDTPQKIYTGENDLINITFSLTDQKISNEEMISYKNKQADYYKENATLKTATIDKIDGHNVVNIEYTDKDMYYNVIYFSYNDYLGIVTFNCSMDIIGEWQPVSKFVIESIYFK